MKTTSLTVRQARADLLADWISRNPTIVATVDDIPRLPHIQAWNPAVLQDAIDDNVATGRFAEDAHGYLVVTDQRTAAR